MELKPNNATCGLVMEWAQVIMDTGSHKLLLFDINYCLSSHNYYHHRNCFNKSASTPPLPEVDLAPTLEAL